MDTQEDTIYLPMAVTLDRSLTFVNYILILYPKYPTSLTLTIVDLRFKNLRVLL